MKIQNTNYLSCHCSTNKPQKQNPSFKKLLLKPRMPLDMLQAISKNDELKYLVKKFHEIGLDVSARGDLSSVVGVIEYLHLYTSRDEHLQKHIESFVYLSKCEAGNSCYPIAEQLERLEAGFAEKTFNQYIMNLSNKDKEIQLKKTQ